MSSNVVNLRKTRKNRDQQAKRKAADANSAAYGIPKSQRDLQNAKSQKAARDLDNHKRDV